MPAHKMAVGYGCPLTERQFEAVNLLGQGLSYKEIGEAMGCMASTVRQHLHNAYQRLGVSKGIEAVRIANEAGWLDPVDISWEDRRVTAAQSLYLDAFDRLLDAIKANDWRREEKARLELVHYMTSIQVESGWVRVGSRDERRSRGLADGTMGSLIRAVLG